MAETNGQVQQPDSLDANVKMPGAPDVSGAPTGLEKPAPFRSKNARPLGDDAAREEQARLAVQVAAQGQKLDKLIETVATIGAPTRPSTKAPEEIASEVSAEEIYGKLKVRLEKNGDTVFSLPLDVVRDPFRLSADSREAFREVGKGYAQQIQVTGSSDRQIRAAMEYAKIRWNGDPITIRVGDEHAPKIVKHAVAANVNIDTSRDPRLAELVAEERKRQAVDVGKSQDVVLLERVQVTREKKEDQKQSVGMRV